MFLRRMRKGVLAVGGRWVCVAAWLLEESDVCGGQSFCFARELKGSAAGAGLARRTRAERPAIRVLFLLR